MAGPAFDPNGAVRFDLKNGAAADARGARLMVLPAAALEDIEQEHPEAVEAIGEALGRACGARVAARLGGESGVRNATLEIVVSHLAGELAVAGFGSLHLERWGRALVCVVTNPALAGDAFCGAVLAAAVGAAAGRTLAAAPLGRDGGALRFFLGSKATAERVRALVAEGKGYADAVSAVQGGAA